MRSPAYRDFLVRAAEAQLLVRQAVAATSPEVAGALAKGAAVLTAASLERYVNDFLAALCRQTRVQSWSELTEGQQRYLAFQIAQRVRSASNRLVARKQRDVGDKARARLSNALSEGVTAFNSPDSWNHHRSYGMFMDGAAEPARLDGTLRLFIPDEKGFFESLTERGRDRGALATALEGLIDARHRVAHAVAGPSVGPTDIRLWLRLTRLLVRDIETVLWTFNGMAASHDEAGEDKNQDLSVGASD